MRVFIAALVALVLTSTAGAASGGRIVAHGVRLDIPAGWQQATAASDGPVVDPKTLLVVGTAGVHPRASRCQIAAYSIPADGAVVVIVGWKTRTARSARWRASNRRSPMRRRQKRDDDGGGRFHCVWEKRLAAHPRLPTAGSSSLHRAVHDGKLRPTSAVA